MLASGTTRIFRTARTYSSGSTPISRAIRRNFSSSGGSGRTWPPSMEPIWRPSTMMGAAKSIRPPWQ